MLTGAETTVVPRVPVDALPDANGPTQGDREPLYTKLKWLTLFRLAMITVLLGGTILVEFRSEQLPGPEPLYVLIIATYAASLVYALALRRHWRLSIVGHAQIVGDVAIAASVVWLTGKGESVFVFLFTAAIVGGSILLFRRGAFVSAGMSLVAYVPIALTGSPRPAAMVLFVHVTAFVVTAALGGYLAEQLRKTSERLAVREDDLAAITALHESIVQSVASGIVTIDAKGRITFLNRAAEGMTGLKNTEVRGLPSTRWFAAFVPGTSRGEADLANVDGETLRVGYTIFPLVGTDARPLGSAVIFQDLTAIRAMEAQIQRSERLADLGHMAAGLAHELRNPLASMTGSIELLRSSAPLCADDARLMDIVLREAGRLDQLVSQFLTFTRPDSARRVTTDLADVARDTIAVFSNDPAASRVRVESDLRPAPTRCDPDQIRQVLWNLLRNAAEAATDAGPQPGLVSLATAIAGSRVVLAVEDDGRGIAAADLPHIFTPFYTTKRSGSGLGLPTVQRIVDAHGGTIAVGERPNGGTRFIVALPGVPTDV